MRLVERFGAHVLGEICLGAVKYVDDLGTKAAHELRAVEG